MTETTTRTVRLVVPIQREGAPAVTEITLTKPTTGALRGLSLMNLMQMEVNAISLVLPRISSPALLPGDVAALDPVDLLSLAGEILAFFTPPEALEALGLTNR